MLRFRLFLVLVLVVASLVLIAWDPGQVIPIDNQTDVELCTQFYGGYVSKLKSPDEGEQACDFQKPHSLMRWTTGCYEDETIWIVIKVSGERLYS